METAKEKSIPLKIALIEGDDIHGTLAEILAKGESLENLETGENFLKIKGQTKSANVYLGCESILEALQKDAQIIITGRVADPSMVLGALRFEFGWKEDDWNSLAAGSLAGHLIECGAQASGGNYSYDWQKVLDPANIGFPIAEVSEDGSFIITKHDGTGGEVSLPSVKEQMVYEIGDPKAYLTPDVSVNFTSARLEQVSKDKVKISNVQGSPRPERLKVSISYFYGYRAVGTLVYSWPDAYKKAKAAEQIIRTRIKDLNLDFEKTNCEIVGANACHGPIVDRDDPELPEVTFRFAVLGRNQLHVRRFTREIAPLILSGPPFAADYAGGKGGVSEVFAYWPTLIARDKVNPSVSILDS
jgi:hypothetical protein